MILKGVWQDEAQLVLEVRSTDKHCPWAGQMGAREKGQRERGASRSHGQRRTSGMHIQGPEERQRTNFQRC